MSKYTPHEKKIWQSGFFKGEEFDKEINANRTVLHFLDFCQSVGIDAFIEYLKENVDFEKHSYITKENNKDET